MSKPGDEKPKGRWLREYFNDPNRDEDSVTGKFFDAGLFARLFRYVLPFKKFLILTLISLAVLRIGSLIPPYIFKIIIDSYLTNPTVESVDRFTGIAWLIMAVLFASIATVAANYANIVASAELGQRSMHSLRLTIYRHIISQSVRFFGSQPVGRLLTRTTNDVNAVNEMVSSSLAVLVGDMLTIGGAIAMMFWISWEFALVAMAVMPFILATSFFFRRKVRNSYRLLRWLSARINAFLSEYLSGIRIIQLFRNERRAAKTFYELNHDMMTANLRNSFIVSVFTPILEVFGSAAKALVLYYAGGAFIQDKVELGALIGFFAYFDMAMGPVRELAEQYNVFQGAMASSERIFRILDTVPEVQDPASPTTHTIEGRVDFEKMNFAYEGETYVLQDVDLSISKGESVAIVGATGAGKSSMINILGRFYDVRSGSVKIDGIDVREYTLDDLHSSIVVVPQDVFIFSDTVMENIRLWNPTISRERIIAAAEYVNADKFIRALPDGYDTVLKERGAGLSVGQKQLLSFARALAFEPKILVLDEATSSVDPETEELIQDALRKLMIGRTSIFIAHRLSTVRNCNRIVVLHKGRIREIGTHEELYAMDGVYRKLYELQYRIQNLKAS
ncbi:MAG: ABC transporter ATP-binding protein [Candidatus Brocadiia bacterium]